MNIEAVSLIKPNKSTSHFIDIEFKTYVMVFKGCPSIKVSCIKEKHFLKPYATYGRNEGIFL